MIQARTDPTPVISTRALNRALLARQQFLARAAQTAEQMVEHLVGLQAQVPNNPYVALWSRLEGFDPMELSELIGDRRAVRLAVMRSTLHLLTARDCVTLRPAMQPALDRALYQSSPYGRGIAGVDVEELLALGRALLEERPRTIAELRTLLHPHWPGHDPSSLAYAVHYSLPLVQIPPRGLWEKSGRPTCTTAEVWLSQPLGPAISPEELVRRYLAAFGPATPRDLQTWSGLPTLSPVFEQLRPQLITFRDERGRELFDLPDAPRPGPDVPAPPRFLPEYDNVFLSHADRSRIVADERRQGWYFNQAGYPVLIDGFIAGTWKLVRERDDASLTVRTFEAVSEPDRTQLLEEGERLLALLAPDVNAEVQIEAEKG
jgi:hypothetical protein